MSEQGQSTRGVFRFTWRFGRQGTLKGLFVAEKKEIEEAIGRDAYFGEVLGKHSEVYGEIKEGDIVLLTDDKSFVSKFDEFECGTGYNPLDYLKCKGCGNREDDCECPSSDET